MILFLGSVVLLAAAGDLRMLMRGGVFGRQRIARHLWRMCFGLFIATGSFLAQRRVLAFLGGPKIMLLAALPLILMIFWLIRVRFKNAYKRKSAPGSGDLHSLPT
jgi:amino acid permease